MRVGAQQLMAVKKLNIFRNFFFLIFATYLSDPYLCLVKSQLHYL